MLAGTFFAPNRRNAVTPCPAEYRVERIPPRDLHVSLTPPASSLRRPCRLVKTRDVILLSALVLLVPITARVGLADPSAPENHPGVQINVWTQNLYIGAGIQPVLAAESPTEIVARADALYQNVTATDFPARARAIAKAMRAEPPDVLGLQEVALWRTRRPGDDPTGRTATAQVAYDFLALLLAELKAAGLTYEVASVSTNADIELPTIHYGNVRLTDRDVILVASGLETDGASSGHYAAQVIARLGGQAGRVVSFNRGWTAVNVRKDGISFRVVNTHLELQGEVQNAQRKELGTITARSPHPVILVGDLNFAPGEDDPILQGTGSSDRLTDVWATLRGKEDGFTCCRDAALQNATDTLTKRVDLMLCSPSFVPVAIARVGAAPSSRVRSQKREPVLLWMSDHAGLRATFSLERPEADPGKE